MSDFSAIIPAADMDAANAALGAQGFGLDNFSVPAYEGPSPQFAVLHCWNNPAFQAAVEALPNVTVEVNPGTSSPTQLASNVCVAVGAEWAADAKPLTGVVTPGLYRDDLNVLWWVIQQYDTAIWPDPLAVPALIRVAKVPGQVLPWQQPLDQFDAYKLVNPFTGEPDRCTHNGEEWYVTQADGAGNNIWEPGVFGWTIA